MNMRTEHNSKLSFRTKALLKLYRKKIQTHKCYCGMEYGDEPIRFYPHPNGWNIGEDSLQWLFIRCPRCKVDVALWKLGVHN